MPSLQALHSGADNRAQNSNKVMILQLDEQKGEFQESAVFDHPYPTTKVCCLCHPPSPPPLPSAFLCVFLCVVVACACVCVLACVYVCTCRMLGKRNSGHPGRLSSLMMAGRRMHKNCLAECMCIAHSHVYICTDMCTNIICTVNAHTSIYRYLYSYKQDSYTLSLFLSLCISL